MGVKAEIQKFQQPGPLAGRIAYTVRVMQRAGCSDAEIVAALKALCEAAIAEEMYQWQR